MMRYISCICAVLGLFIFCQIANAGGGAGSNWTSSQANVSDDSAPSSETVLPVPYPSGFRTWQHVKSMVIHHKKHPLYDAFAGIHHIYADKKATKALLENKRFPRGAQIVFDLFSIRDKDGAMTESSRKFTAVMVKDDKKYASTGGWGWQAWVGGDRRSPALKSRSEQQACATCHEEVQSKGLVFSQWRD